MSGYAFQFGIEIELLIGSRSKTHKSWKSLASELSVRLASAGIPNHLNEGNEKSPDNYYEWSITQEVTIPAQAGKNLWGLELVSPILTPGYSDLSTVFAVLRSGFTLAHSPSCSTHVHLSTSPALDAARLAAVAKAVLFFEPALDALLPPARASSYWCQSNRANPSLKPLASVPLCFERLDACADVAAVVRAMCLFPARSAYGRANGFTEDFVHGVYKWDFSGLDGGIGTLEFRQAPGSRSAEDATTWAELAVCFVAGAMEQGAGLDPYAQVSMEDLWWLLSVGAQVTGFGDLSGVERLYAQAGKKPKYGRK